MIIGAFASQCLTEQVCQHGDNHNSGPSGLGCRNLTWAICAQHPSAMCAALYPGSVPPSSHTLCVCVRARVCRVVRVLLLVVQILTAPTGFQRMVRPVAPGTAGLPSTGTCCLHPWAARCTQRRATTTSQTVSASPSGPKHCQLAFVTSCGLALTFICCCCIVVSADIVISSVTQPGWGALSIGAVNNASTERRPGSHFNTNIFMIELPAGTDPASCGTDSKSPRPFPCPLVVGGDFYDDLGETGAGTATRWAGSDNNVFWSPNGAPIRFTDDGLSLAEWKQQNRTVGGPPDQHSRIADPLFADPARGDYSLKPNSPALALGFVPIPPIHAPFFSAS